MISAEHQEKDKRYHDTIGAEYHTVVVEPRALPNAHLFKDIDRAIGQGQSMLDVGCGTGHMLLRFGPRFQQLTGVDHSASMLVSAAGNLSKHDLSANLVETELTSFLESTSTMHDLISCVGCLHHLQLDTIPTVIARLGELLSPRGALVIAEPIETDLSLQPERIATWNAGSLAAHLEYSQEEEEPDEAPIPYELLKDSLSKANLKIRIEARAWEVFPHRNPPSLIDRLTIRYFHWRYGKTGNVLALMARHTT